MNPLYRAYYVGFLELPHFLMERRMLLGIKQRVEQLAPARVREEAGTLKHLYEGHVAAGAKLVLPFAGWEMPVQYDGIRDEHLRVRSKCGVFDVSHMGEIETEGPRAAELLQRLLSNDVSKIQVGARSTRASAVRTAACSTTCSPTGWTMTAI